MHSQPPGTDAEAALDRIQARIRHITTLATWQARAADSETSLHRQLLQAKADLAQARALIVIQQSILGPNSPTLPPPQLIAAWRAGSPDYLPVTVEIDGAAVTLIVHGPPRAADPLREAHDWHRVQQVWREVHHEIQGAA
ncbi:hypothetical protein [Streptosporangium carneum]|uniref:Uncharacterized protein n=1 Tax=Streptosporangium carneum TaxID=47481 RepID=A0A9W6MAZ5_9ACTN|nr:hypothetical protein [Streptosporangium carneum]GLK07255.1 hypothetical protein GCM10017600_06600 [Streptosporangium carneum]